MIQASFPCRAERAVVRVRTRDDGTFEFEIEHVPELGDRNVFKFNRDEAWRIFDVLLAAIREDGQRSQN